MTSALNAERGHTSRPLGERSSLTFLLAVRLGRLADAAFELLDEITGGLETAILRDLAYGKTGGLQETARVVTTKRKQIVGKTHAKGFFKASAETRD